MNSRLVWSSLAVLAVAATARAGPPVTSPEAPSPTAEAARRWAMAAFEYSFDRYLANAGPRSEAVRMFSTVQRGEPMRVGTGWFEPSQSRYDWAGVSQRHDRDGNRRLTRDELSADGEFFSRLDRDRDGVLTEADFDWSEQSFLVKQDAQALRLFRAIDANGNGQISESEMQSYFKRLSGEKGHLNADDLRRALALEPPQKKGGKGKGAPQSVWLEALLASDLGSPFEGPRLGEAAPDFTLPTQDGLGRLTLSDFRGKKPVVLIFGSFT
jgi:hypothetical protein